MLEDLLPAAGAALLQSLPFVQPRAFRVRFRLRLRVRVMVRVKVVCVLLLDIFNVQ